MNVRTAAGLGLFCLAGACKRPPADARPEFASSPTFFEHNLINGLRATGGRLEVCVEIRDKTSLSAEDERIRLAAANAFQWAVETWARASGLASDSLDVRPFLGEFDGCPGDLNGGRAALHLLTTSDGWKVRMRGETASVANADNRIGVIAVPTFNMSPDGNLFRAVILHETGHLFGLADTYYGTDGTLVGATDTQAPSVMAGNMQMSLAPDDIMGIHALVSLLSKGQPLTGLCEPVSGKGYRATRPQSVGTVGIIYDNETVLFCGDPNRPAQQE